MKTTYLLFTLSTFLLTAAISFGQCTNCNNLEEALKAPSKVQVLNLRASNLTEIPKEINQFVNLQKLILSENLITELNAKSIRLPQLKVLDLSYNPGFLGMTLIDLEIAFPQLIELNLEGNQMNYIAWNLANCSSLKKLNLSHNNFILLPFEYGLLNLEVVDLSHNRLTDIDFVRACWKIKWLDVNYNPNLRLFKLGNDLREKDSLTFLSISPNKNSNGVPKNFNELTFSELKIDGGFIKNSNPKWLTNEWLTTLTIENCQILKTDAFMRDLNRLPELEKVRVVGSTEKDLDKIRNIDTLILVDVRPDIDYKTNYPKKLFIQRIDLLPSGPVATSNSWVNTAMLKNEVETIQKPEAKVLTIPSNQEAQIEGSFTKLEVPTNAFLSQDGSVYNGPVKVELTEYSDPIINALSGAPMVYSTPTGNELFASSGMFEFKASSESGEELQPNPDAPIQVTLQDAQPTQYADLYSYNKESMNWEALDEMLRSEPLVDRKEYIDSVNALTDSSLVYYNEKKPTVRLYFKKQRNKPSELSFSTHTNYKWKKNKGNTIYYKNEDEMYLASHRYQLDTLLSDSLVELFKQMKKSQKKLLKVPKKGLFGDDTPCLVEEAKLTPDPERDNYRLTFTYKDEKVNLPVIYLYPGKSLSQVQTQERKRLKKYQAAVRKGDKEQAKIDLYKAEIFEEQVKAERQRLLGAPVPGVGMAATGTYTFPLRTFGLVNCDYFMRTPPQELIAVSEKAKNQNGQEVPVNDNIMYIDMESNFYCVAYRYSLPLQKSSSVIYFFKSSDTEIAVVEGWEVEKDGTRVPRVKTFSTQSLNAKDISKEIIAIHEGS